MISSGTRTVISVLDNASLVGKRVDLLHPLDEIPDFRLCDLHMMGIMFYLHGLRTFDPERSVIAVTDMQVGRWVSDDMGVSCRLSEGQDIAPFGRNGVLQPRRRRLKTSPELNDNIPLLSLFMCHVFSFLLWFFSIMFISLLILASVSQKSLLSILKVASSLICCGILKSVSCRILSSASLAVIG